MCKNVQTEASMLNTLPTNGVELETLSYKKHKYVVREIGGNFLPVWPKYYESSLMVIYMVDMANYSQISLTWIEFLNLLCHKGLYKKNVLLLLNKIDQPYAMGRHLLQHIVHLDAALKEAYARFGQAIWVEEVSAVKGVNLDKVLTWMHDTKRSLSHTNPTPPLIPNISPTTPSQTRSFLSPHTTTPFSEQNKKSAQTNNPPPDNTKLSSTNVNNINGNNKNTNVSHTTVNSTDGNGNVNVNNTNINNTNINNTNINNTNINNANNSNNPDMTAGYNNNTNNNNVNIYTTDNGNKTSFNVGINNTNINTNDNENNDNTNNKEENRNDTSPKNTHAKENNRNSPNNIGITVNNTNVNNNSTNNTNNNTTVIHIHRINNEHHNEDDNQINYNTDDNTENSSNNNSNQNNTEFDEENGTRILNKNTGIDR